MAQPPHKIDDKQGDHDHSDGRCQPFVYRCHRLEIVSDLAAKEEEPNWLRGSDST
jgi:hypothetical protein